MKTPGKQNSVWRFAGLGAQWAVMLLIAVWGGYKLDQRLWKAPVFIILFPLISLVLSFRQLMSMINTPKDE